jgi:ribosomal protein L22
MADETEETPSEEPKRRRLRLGRGAGASDDAPATEPASSEDASASEAATQASDAETSSEVAPDAADIEAEEAASDVVLEADAEAEGEFEPDSEQADEEPPAEPPAAPPARAPSRRRRGRERDPDLPPPVVRAQAKYVRSSARKARLVCDHIRGKTVDEARAILAHTPRAVARDWSKLLESAVANAEHNHELVGEDLYVKAVHADEGPTIKRFRPRAMGRATRIRKRTSHLTILLTPKE